MVVFKEASPEMHPLKNFHIGQHVRDPHVSRGTVFAMLGAAWERSWVSSGWGVVDLGGHSPFLVIK